VAVSLECRERSRLAAAVAAARRRPVLLLVVALASGDPLDDQRADGPVDLPVDERLELSPVLADERSNALLEGRRQGLGHPAIFAPAVEFVEHGQPAPSQASGRRSFRRSSRWGSANDLQRDLDRPSFALLVAATGVRPLTAAYDPKLTARMSTMALLNLCITIPG
jgi:hypothetical protein